MEGVLCPSVSQRMKSIKKESNRQKFTEIGANLYLYRLWRQNIQVTKTCNGRSNYGCSNNHSLCHFHIYRTWCIALWDCEQKVGSISVCFPLATNSQRWFLSTMTTIFSWPSCFCALTQPNLCVDRLENAFMVCNIDLEVRDKLCHPVDKGSDQKPLTWVIPGGNLSFNLEDLLIYRLSH